MLKIKYNNKLSAIKIQQFKKLNTLKIEYI